MIHHFRDGIAPLYQQQIRHDLKLFESQWSALPRTVLDYEVDDPLVIDTGMDEIILKRSDELPVEPPQNNLFFFILPVVLTALSQVNRLPKSIHRAKFNRLLQNGSSNNNYNIPHTDHYESGFTSVLYYVNDSDGDTFFFLDGGSTRITPRQGDIVVFDSDILHASSNPIQSKERIVLNVVIETYMGNTNATKD